MRAPALLLFAVLASLTALVACSNQGEGEYCDPMNGDNDCQSGLVCIAAPGLTGMFTSRCCPMSAADATTAACGLNTTTALDASAAIGDTGSPSEASVADAVGDVLAADAPADVVASSPEAGPEGGAGAAPDGGAGASADGGADASPE
jgi:hypothetical protein